MRAMVLNKVGEPLELKEVPRPSFKPHQVLIHVSVCGICRTDLHILDGELPSPKLPLILGHQIVGEIVEIGESVKSVKVGDRVGVPWLGGSCGNCEYCQVGKENLCNQSIFTGYQIDGGFAEYCVADAAFIFSLPTSFTDLQVAPLLCAGLIGFRALRMLGMLGSAKRIGFYGFGTSAHILIQIVRYQGGEVYAFTRPGNTKGQDFAKKLGATWVGSSEEEPPCELDGAILFAQEGALVPKALKALKKGGTLVCAEIYMNNIPSFPYSLLWNERVLRSVANLTREDGEEFFALAPRIPLVTEVHPYPLEQLNQALEDLRGGRVSGGAVVII